MSALLARTGKAQAPSVPPTSPADSPASSTPTLTPDADNATLPEAPSPAQSADVVALSQSLIRAGDAVPPRRLGQGIPIWSTDLDPGPYRRLQLRRARILNSSQQFLDTTFTLPMTPEQKLFIAGTDVIDPFNLVTLVGSSAYYVGTTPHSAYGPGLAGFGRHVGYSLSQDVTGEFLGTFAIPALTHQDPRYFRMPHAPISRRIMHAVAHTFIARRDNGGNMPNYGILGTYPITALLANAYVPGVHTDPESTAARIGVGLATDPAATLIDEFLPDFARRVHVRVVFFQQIINSISAGPTTQ